MAAYEMNVNATVTGGPSLDALAASTAKASAETASYNNVLYGSTAAQEKQTLALIKYQTEQVKTAGYLAIYNTELLKNERASLGAAAGQEVLAAATGRVVGNTMAASTALRVMEGAMPLRAAASFLGTIQGLAPALQMAFPIFGAIALFEVATKITTEVGKHLDLWHEISNAEKAATEDLKKYGDEARKNILDLRKLQREAVRHQEGPAAEAVAESADTHADLANAKNLAALAREKVEALQQYIKNAGTPTLAQTMRGGEYRWDVSLSPQQQAYVNSYMQEYDKNGNPTSTQSHSNVTGQPLPYPLGSKERAAAAEHLRAAQEASRAASTEVGRLQQKSVTDAIKLGPSPEDLARQKKEEERKAAEAAKEDARKTKEWEDRLAEDQRATSARGDRFGIPGKNYGGWAGGGAFERDLDARRMTARRATADKIREVNESDLSPAEKARLIQGYTADGASAELDIIRGNPDDAAKRAEAIADIPNQVPTVRAAKDPNSKEDKEWADAAREEGGLFYRPPLGYGPSAAEQARLARNFASNSLQQAQRAGKDQDPMHAANNEYAARIAGIAAVEAAEKHEHDSKQGWADAEEEASQKTHEAAMQREDALKAIIDQQKEAARSLAGGLFDAIHSHSTNQWTRAFGVGQEKALFENLASIPIGAVSKSLGGAIGGQTDAQGNPTFLGTLLHGTLLSSANADPAKTTATNTGETVKQLLLMRGDMKSFATGNTGAADPNAISAATGSAAAGVAADLPLNGTNPMLGMLGTTEGFTSSPLAGIASAVSGFGKGFSGGPSAAVSALLDNTPPGTVGWNSDGNPTDQWGNVITQSAATQFGEGASIAGAVGAAGMGIASGLKQGGTSGDLKAASSGLSLGAMLPPPAGPAFAAASTVTAMLASVLGQGPVQRAQQITDDINKDQYLAPTALNVTQSMDGTYQSFDARGNLRTSTMRAVPTVAEPYITTRELNGSQSWYDAPGNVTQPYQGGATGTGQNPVGNGPVAGAGPASSHIVIQAMDAQSFTEFADKNSRALGEAVATHLQNHEGRLSNQIRYVAGAV